jgi:hypothetical protein
MCYSPSLSHLTEHAQLSQYLLTARPEAALPAMLLPLLLLLTLWLLLLLMQTRTSFHTQRTIGNTI